MGTTEDLNEISERISYLFETLRQSGKVSTQTDFAEKLEVNRITLRSYLNNEREPGIRFLRALHTNFSVNINWIISGKGPMFLQNDYIKLENLLDKLDAADRIRMIIQSELLGRQSLEVEKLKASILLLGLEAEKRVIFEERSEGLLRNYHAKRIEIHVLKMKLKNDRRKNQEKPQLTPGAIIEIECANMIKNFNQQISDFVSGKSKEFKNIIKQINSINHL